MKLKQKKNDHDKQLNVLMINKSYDLKMNFSMKHKLQIVVLRF